MLHEILAKIVDFVEQFGYLGIFIMTFLESTFVPIPSEVTMVPAGYLAYQGHLNIGIVFAASIAGTLGGSLFNYWLAIRFGRHLLLKIGHYCFMNAEKLAKIEGFFANHGEISIFTGRLIPGLRHFISFPAGLSRMSLKTFCVYTAFGGGLWMATLIGLGYFIGHNRTLLHHYLTVITWVVLAALVLLVGFYVWRQRKNTKNT